VTDTSRYKSSVGYYVSENKALSEETAGINALIMWKISIELIQISQY